MREKIVILCIASLATIILLSPVTTEAVDNAFAFKIGYQMFRSDEGWDELGILGDDSSYFNGRNYSLEWDIYPVDYFGLRFTLEYFRQNRRIDYNYNDPYPPAYSDYRTLTIIPMTVSTKFRVPTPFVSPYFFAGFGFCYWGVYESYGESHWYSDDDKYLQLIQENDGITFQVGTGIEFKLTPHLSFLLEGEYRSLIIDFHRYGNNLDLDASVILLTTGLMFK